MFFGTSAFAVPSLRVTAERTSLAGVVTQPDRPSGRGMKLTPTPVKSVALELGVPVYEPVRLRAFAQEIAHEAFDLFVLASYGKILPQTLLDQPRLGALNVHPSLLPRYRGATPIQRAIAEGDTETGVSIMLMDAGMDTGDLVLQERVAIGAQETYGDLHDRLAAYGAEMLARSFDLAERGRLPRIAQMGEAVVTRPLTKDDVRIDWSANASHIANHVRSLAPQPAARAEIDGETVKLLRAHALARLTTVSPGTTLGVEGEALLVASADGIVAVDEIVAPNRGRETGASYAMRREVRR